MTETPADNAPETEQLPAAHEAPAAPESPGPETEADAREREIQRRLTQQGRELATARRQADQATATATAMGQQVTEMRAYIQQMAQHLNQRDQREQAERQKQLEAELASLPPADRLQRQVEMLQGQINQMQQRTAAPPARPAQQQPPPAQQQQPAQRQATEEERRQYMEKRVQEIVGEAERTYGVRPSLDEIPDEDWDSEDAFYSAAMRQAQARAGGNGVAQKPQGETAAQMRERIRQEEREKLGATSPSSARPAATGGRKKAATADEVRGAAQSYDSKAGPKANLERMRKLRESMG